MEFKEFSLDERLLEGIDAIGFTEATPIQEQVIPLIMQGHDVIASAQTGTGKTAAFLLPIIHKIITGSGQDNQVKALIIVPTRELAVQIDQQMEGFSYFTPVSSIAVYGGTGGESFAQEKKALSKGADVIIGTPGRLIAHLIMGYVNISGLKYLILDEADRMLDMGFFDDIMKIISYLPEKDRTCCSPPRCRRRSGCWQKRYCMIQKKSASPCRSRQRKSCNWRMWSIKIRRSRWWLTCCSRNS
jgi:superfamily II DNA/RNA helicase